MEELGYLQSTWNKLKKPVVNGQIIGSLGILCYCWPFQARFDVLNGDERKTKTHSDIWCPVKMEFRTKNLIGWGRLGHNWKYQYCCCKILILYITKNISWKSSLCPNNDNWKCSNVPWKKNLIFRPTYFLTQILL